METIDRILARRRREREQETGIRTFADRSDTLTRLTIKGLASSGDLPDDDGGGRTLSFAQTGAGARLAAQYALDEERQRGRERLTLENTLFGLARELLPAGDVDVAIQGIQRGELIKSKLQFQAAIQALADRQDIALRQEELDMREEVEAKTLRQARARIVVDMIGKDVGRAVLYALSTGGR